MVLINGAASDTPVAVDRGLAYGDGVFRTLVISDGRPRSWPYHYRKLARDCAALTIPCPGEELLREELAVLAAQTPGCVAKIIVTRGTGQRGYAPPVPVHSTRIVMSAPLPWHPTEFAHAGVSIRLCSLRLGSQPALAGIKHLNRLENVLARTEWSDPEIAEGLLLDGGDHLVGGTMTNLFIVEQGALATPDLSQCGVAGVTRERIMDATAKHGTACREEHIGLERLLAADEVWLTNSVIGIWQARRLGNTAWTPGSMVWRMRQWLDEEDD